MRKKKKKKKKSYKQLYINL